MTFKQIHAKINHHSNIIALNDILLHSNLFMFLC